MVTTIEEKIMMRDLDGAFSIAKAQNEQELMMRIGELMYCPVTEYVEMEEDILDYIRSVKCRHTSCNSLHGYERFDAYGITTGNWCDACYESGRYPYRKDRYPTIEFDGYGERLSDDY